MMVLEGQLRVERKGREEDSQALKLEMAQHKEREAARLESCQQQWESRFEQQAEEARRLMQQCAAEVEAG